MHFHGPGLDTGDLSLKDVQFKHMARLKEFLRPYAGHLILAMCLVVAITVLGLIGPLLTRQALDVYIPARDWNGLNRIILIYVLIQATIYTLRYSQTYIMSWAGQRILYLMRRKMFVHLQDLGLDFYDRMQAGRIMSRLTSDIDALNELITGGVINLLSDVLSLVGIMYIMLRVNYRLALVSFITLPLLFITVWSLRFRMTRAYHKVRRRIADVNANLQESISGMRIVQAFSREDVNMERFSETNLRNFQANMEAQTLHALFLPLVEVIGSIGTATVIYYGGLRMSWGDTAITVGTLWAFLQYVTRFFWPVRELSEIYNLVLQGAVSAERVFEVLDWEPNVKDKPDAIWLSDVAGHVQFKNVTFEYEKGLPVLHDVNLEARPGETIALVGPTGAGKSTIISLLCRFYDVTGGAVLIDGIDIRDIAIASLRKHMGIVLQDTFIFSGTIMENIRYGRLDATDEEVKEAARLVGADDFISRMPQGYQTQVGERGSRLSVGQRQLLAFARALLADPKILILDEATSSVDSYTELLIQKALERLLKGRTAFVIAHRLSTIRNADRIYVIDGGRVVQAGTHEELLAQGGLYKELYEKQFSGNPLDKEAAC
ncbi:MAG: ABC transporter ATP-binding protein [Firmicutes bacterium]|nr:ABC transporter ATP-binding protein [Candidatus Fermentithermobacillaceae bacterium]